MTTKIKMLLASKDMTISELAEKMGTTQPNLSAKLKRDNFSEKELNQIAEVLEVQYESNFVLEDGRKIWSQITIKVVCFFRPHIATSFTMQYDRTTIKSFGGI